MSEPVGLGGPDALARLRELMCDAGGLMASLVDEDAGDGRHSAEGHTPSPASVAASGPRAAAKRDEYELLVEAIYEGYLLHYGAPRVLVSREANLSLLAGDQLYAIGLARLVALGDTFAVAELADTITLSALAQGTRNDDLADAVWAAGARAVGWGPSEIHRRAKQLVFAGDPRAFEAMRTSAEAQPASP